MNLTCSHQPYLQHLMHRWVWEQSSPLQPISWESCGADFRIKYCRRKRAVLWCLCCCDYTRVGTDWLPEQYSSHRVKEAHLPDKSNKLPVYLGKHNVLRYCRKLARLWHQGCDCDSWAYNLIYAVKTREVWGSGNSSINALWDTGNQAGSSLQLL